MDTAPINANPRRKNVEEAEGSRCSAPKSFLVRMFCCILVPRKKRGFRKIDEKRPNKLVMASTNGERESEPKPKPPTTEVLEESGQHREVSFNSGLGFGLIYLLVASKNELNKVQELHKEMEMLLKSSKDRLHNSIPTPSRQNNVVKSPTQTDVSCQEYPCSSYIDDENIPQCYIISRQESKRKIVMLEAELEAELEHLQLQLDTELLLYRKQGEYTEIIGEDSGPEGSQITSFEEFIDEPEVASEVRSNGEYHGVSPIELERRLHEVLEASQQEKIKELELALDRAKKRIHELEKDISWWKDTANIVYQHVPVKSDL